MISEEKIIKILHNKSEDRILELRKNCKEYSQINDFLYKSTEKIFKKFIFPYFRFEILLNCIADIKNNKQHYPIMTTYEIDKINSIYNKLLKICVHLNVVLSEYQEIIAHIEKR